MKVHAFLFALAPALLLSSSSWAKWEQKNFDSTSYFQYTPEKESTGKNSLLMVLHGCAQKAQDLATYGNIEMAAERHNAIVVAPQVPGGGVVMGCWDYYGNNHTAENHHTGALVGLLKHLKETMRDRLDSTKIYVAGLSSGGAQALLLGCLRPDLISGVALNSSPAIPSTMQEISRPNTTAEQMAEFCQKLAGPLAGHLENQKSTVLTSDRDFTVSIEHSKIISKAYQLLTGARSEKRLSLEGITGTNLKGEMFEYSNSHGEVRTSLIFNQGLGHNWAAGGEHLGGSFVTQNSINYSLYFLGFFETRPANSDSSLHHE